MTSEESKALVRRWNEVGHFTPEGLSMVTDDFRWIMPPSMEEEFFGREDSLRGPAALARIPLLDKAVYSDFSESDREVEVRMPAEPGDWRSQRAAAEAALAAWEAAAAEHGEITRSDFEVISRDGVAVPLRWYTPPGYDTSAAAGPAAVYLHGGGMFWAASTCTTGMWRPTSPIAAYRCSLSTTGVRPRPRTQPPWRTATAACAGWSSMPASSGWNRSESR